MFSSLSLLSGYSELKGNLSLTFLFLFHPFGSTVVVHLEFLTSMSLPISHRKVANCPLTNYTSSSSTVWYFSYTMKWLIYQHSGQIKPQIIMCCGLIPCQIWFLHWAQSLLSYLESPNPTIFSHFTWLTYFTVSMQWEVVFSLIHRTCVLCWMESLAFSQIFLPPKDALDILLILECGSRLLPWCLPHGFLASHGTECFRDCSSWGVFPNDARLVLITYQKWPQFLITGFPSASFSSCMVSMGLGQHALTEVLVILCWLQTTTVQRFSLSIFIHKFKVCPIWIQSRHLDNLHGSNLDQL